MAKSREESPSFQMYPKDYLSSSAVAGMTLEEQGAYLRLLFFSWLDGSIPAALSGLARLCGTTERQMQKVWEAVSPCFVPLDTDPSRLVNARLEKERTAQRQRRAERGVAGTRGAKQRWQNDGSAMAQPSQIDSKESPPVSDQPMANDSLAFASSSALPLALEEQASPGDAEAPPRGMPKSLQQEAVDQVWAVYEGVGATRPAAGVVGEWRKLFKYDTQRLLATIRDLAVRGVLNDKSSSYVYGVIRNAVGDGPALATREVLAPGGTSQLNAEASAFSQLLGVKAEKGAADV
jgi:uncharacterized protein YdaU (DUF1376 family)